LTYYQDFCPGELAEDGPHPVLPFFPGFPGKFPFSPQPVFYNDYKVNRCASGVPRVTVEAFSDSAWTLKFQTYDDKHCTIPSENSWTVTYRKNMCYRDGDFLVMLNVMGEPTKAIPGGGNALVFYENDDDCRISKHTNLGRAVFVATYPMDKCSTSPQGLDWKAKSCANDLMTYGTYETNNLSCGGGLLLTQKPLAVAAPKAAVATTTAAVKPLKDELHEIFGIQSGGDENSGNEVILTINQKSEACTRGYGLPVRFLCVADDGTQPQDGIELINITEGR
jgi:hypothetical protein